MLKSTDRLANEKAEREAAAKAARRAEEAAIVNGLRTVIQPNEQLLGFARGVISGGIKGKLNIGPEAFFAPFINIGLTERRVVLQHLHGETGRPSEILPHFFPLADLQSIHFSDIETYGGEPACRLVLRLNNEQHFRIRLKGESNFANARALALVFQSLTSVRRTAPSPTQRICAACRHILDHPSKFCPYCGVGQTEPIGDVDVAAESTVDVDAHETEPEVEKVTIIVNEAPPDLLEEALEFLAPVAPGVTEPSEPAESVQKTPEPAPPDTAFTAEPTTTAFQETEPVTEMETPPTTAFAPEATASEAPVAPTDTVTEIEPVTELPSPTDGEAFAAQAVAEAVDESPAPTDAFQDPEAVTETGPTSGAAHADSWGVTPEEVASLLAPIEEPEPTFAPEEPVSETGFDSPASSYVMPGYVMPGVTDPIPQASASPDASLQANAGTEPTSEAPSTQASTSWAWTPQSPMAAFPAVPTPPQTPSGEPSAPPIPPLPPQTEVPAETSTAEQSPPAPVANQPRTLDGPMRIHFHIDDPVLKFDSVISGANADDVVSKIKAQITPTLKFPYKFMVSTMSVLGFAQEVVSQYNAAKQKSLPKPQSCREFLNLMEAEGYATIEETV